MTIQIMLADDNREFLHMLISYIDSQPDMNVMAVAHHGEEALHLLENLPTLPDILLLDVIMPHLDGLAVLERMSVWKPNVPKVIMLTAFGQEHITTRAVELGASYYMLKPFDVNVLGERIRQLASNLDQQRKTVEIREPLNHWRKASTAKSLESEVTAMLNALSIPVHVKGYRYLRESIMMVYQNMEILGAVTHVLYPKVAEKYSSNPSRVERAIRHAISSAWERETLDALRAYGWTKRSQDTRPTNSEFIATLADHLLLSRGKSKTEK